ncbi:MAG TPA: class I lanthipeptide [Thermoanaerobaculia bacterium]|nr:class I lanthipeptide [Thermoanaerobaculia bacterium]
MKSKNKLTLHRETLAHLDRARLARAVGGDSYYGTCDGSCYGTCGCTEDCTNSCQTICWGCEPPSAKVTDCNCF